MGKPLQYQLYRVCQDTSPLFGLILELQRNVSIQWYLALANGCRDGAYAYYHHPLFVRVGYGLDTAYSLHYPSVIAVSPCIACHNKIILADLCWYLGKLLKWYLLPVALMRTVFHCISTLLM